MKIFSVCISKLVIIVLNLPSYLSLVKSYNHLDKGMYNHNGLLQSFLVSLS